MTAAPSSAPASRAPATPSGWRPSPCDEPEPTPAANELAREYRAVLENILHSRGAGRIAAQLREITEPSRLADVSGYSPDLSLTQKVEVLETLDVEERLRLVLGWARDTLADLALREKIKSDVEEGMEKTQREFLLRRQLDAIRKELGELSGDERATRTPTTTGPSSKSADLPEHVRKAVEREVDKLERTSDQSPETGWIRTWLDTVLEIPWGVESEDRLDIAEASRILDADHDGLEDVKERILEHLAVRKLQAERGLAPGGRARVGSHPGPRRARRASARRRSASPWPTRSGASSSGSRWAACATRPRSAATAVPTSAPSRAGWCAPCARPGP